MLRNICFTINNPNDEDIHGLADPRIIYLVYGREVAPETGTPHLQGYAEFAVPTRLTTIKKFMPRAHIESRKGTQEQAIQYCKKDGDFVERGEKKQQGQRNDLDKVRTAALEEGMRGVTARFNHQQIKVAEKFLTYNEEPRDWQPDVYWLWGKTGVGKSKKAREICNEDVYVKNTASKWWDGYDSHTSVIIDDFRDSWWPITEMLSLLDRYEKQVEVKGGMRQFKPRIIVVTSVVPPTACYKGTGEAIEQLSRRINHIENLVTDVTEVAEGNTIPPPPKNMGDIDNIDIGELNL